mmetsp:Transcript_114458/g.364945  ORF Transcript_114458/g.364945 Transcript_114458/m.364945 type:complete len:817 (-) Transcript_114458:91-2541(-)
MNIHGSMDRSTSATSALSARRDMLVEIPDEEPVEDHCGSRFVLCENSPVRTTWTVVLFLLLLYTATIFLYRLCFCVFHINEDGADPIGSDDPFWNTLDRCVDVLFLVDLVANFFLSYKDVRGNEIDSLRRIAKKYLRGLFWMDLVACLPEELVEVILQDVQSENGVNKVVRVSRIHNLSRLVRLARLSRLLKLLTFKSSTNPWWEWVKSLRGVRVISFITALIWSLHLLSCFWYLCASMHEDVQETWVGRRQVDQSGTSLLSQTPFEQWLVAMYFVLTVFTTVGFGDISPVTEAEIIAVAVTMVVGAVVHSFVISRVISIVTSNDQIQEYIERKHQMIDAFSEYGTVTKATRSRLKREIAWRVKAQAVHPSFDREEMAELIQGNTIPAGVLADMAGELFDGSLVKNAFIQCCSSVCYMPPRFPLLLTCFLSRVDFENGEIIYQLHDFPFNLFLVLNGTFAHVARPTEDGGVDEMDADSPLDPDSIEVGQSLGQPSNLFPYRFFSDRSYFGELELFQGCPRTATSRCERSGTLLVLHKADLLRLEDQFPHFHSAWVLAARRRERCRVLACERLTLPLPLRTAAAVQIQAAWRERRKPVRPNGRATPNKTAVFMTVQRQYVLGADIGALTGRSHTTDPGLKALAQTEQLRQSVDTLNTNFKAFQREMRELLRPAGYDCMVEEFQTLRGEVRRLVQDRGQAARRRHSDTTHSRRRSMASVETFSVDMLMFQREVRGLMQSVTSEDTAGEQDDEEVRVHQITTEDTAGEGDVAEAVSGWRSAKDTAGEGDILEAHGLMQSIAAKQSAGEGDAAEARRVVL